MGVKFVFGAVVAAFVALLTPALTGAQITLPIPGAQAPDPNAPPTPRSSEPIVMTGAGFGSWAVPANQTAKLPLTDLIDCHTTSTDSCSHNHYTTPEVDTGDKAG